MGDSNNKLQLTKKGYQDLYGELTDLAEVKRPQLVDRLANARGQGDLSENSDYQNARDELEFLDGRIDELQDVLKNATVVNASTSNGEVSIGNKVKVHIDSAEAVFEIVGEHEANPTERKISPTSPLGKALMGKKVGEIVEVDAPAGKIQYKIVSIE
ncbi:MAG: Transcription elongation factor GreA [Candidatus Woesebacteria bacterium GW2011_GWA1_39_21]|uniref:Transcription elongation factor GreA n=1 Tax=Candidatus Woesebacteria bacterium GW2011_GWA1_39_21 TaxID=1618550 RepID=A0A0G0N229_9BACT|nr:MAG: Transcription elongation factor GreA [Candidatus Woesebacteria bacterium GW2011_GWA1_39_21]